MREITKKRVQNIVKEYRKLFPREYQLAAEGNKRHAENQLTKWGEMKGSDEIGREVLRMPTTLHELLRLKLVKEEVEELESDQGFLWFTRTYPEWVPNIGKE